MPQMLQMKYADWRAQYYVHAVLDAVNKFQASGGAYWNWPWLAQVFPEGRTMNDVGYDGGWNIPDDFYSLTSGVGGNSELVRRVDAIGGLPAIGGGNPEADFAALHAQRVSEGSPSEYVIGPNQYGDPAGMFHFEAHPETTDWLGTGIMYALIIIFTAGAASGAFEAGGTAAAGGAEAASASGAFVGDIPVAGEAGTSVFAEGAAAGATTGAVETGSTFVGDIPIAGETGTSVFAESATASGTALEDAVNAATQETVSNADIAAQTEEAIGTQTASSGSVMSEIESKLPVQDLMKAKELVSTALPIIKKLTGSGSSAAPSSPSNPGAVIVIPGSGQNLSQPSIYAKVKPFALPAAIVAGLLIFH